MTPSSAPKTPTARAADHGRTPENTPIPGGGSWRWDDSAGQWVEVLPSPPAAQPQPSED